MKKLIYDSEIDYDDFDKTKNFIMAERSEEFGDVSDEAVFDYMQEDKQYEWEDLVEPYIKKLFTKKNRIFRNRQTFRSTSFIR